MENNVIISIKGQQHFVDSEEDAIELITAGRLTEQGTEGYTLSYEESEMTGMEGTQTTFQIEKGRITLLRVGEVNSQMVFEEGRKHLSMYDTPFGAMEVGVSAKRVFCEIGEKGGNIEIDYAIEIDHALAGQNLFQINVKKTGLEQ